MNKKVRIEDICDDIACPGDRDFLYYKTKMGLAKSPDHLINGIGGLFVLTGVDHIFGKNSTPVSWDLIHTGVLNKQSFQNKLYR